VVCDVCVCVCVCVSHTQSSSTLVLSNSIHLSDLPRVQRLSHTHTQEFYGNSIIEGGTIVIAKVMCMCVCVCVFACACVCERVFIELGACVCVCVCRCIKARLWRGGRATIIRL